MGVSRPDYDDTTDLDPEAQPEPRRISAFEAGQAPPRAMRPYSLSNQHSLLAAEQKQDYGTTNKSQKFELTSRRTRSSSTKASSWTTGQWTIFEDGTVTGPDDFMADIKDSFKKVCFRRSNWGYKKDKTHVFVRFNKPKHQNQKNNSNHYFSVKDSKHRTNLKSFLKAIKDLLPSYAGANSTTRANKIDTLLTDLGKEYQETRRRMAQREFSSRRDSPVMVKLL